MNLITNIKEIEKQIELINSLIKIEQLDSLEKQNIFNTDYKHFIFMDYFEMKSFEGLEKTIKLSKILNEDFYVNSLENNQRDLCLKIKTNENIHRGFLQVVVKLFEYSHQFCYYSSSLKWLTFFKINWDIAIFMFKEEKDVELFVNIVDKDELYTIDEVVDELWGDPLPEVEKNFKKNYTKLSYLG